MDWIRKRKGYKLHILVFILHTEQKMKFSAKYFFDKNEKIRSFLQICSQKLHFCVVICWNILTSAAQKMMFSIKDFFSKCDQIRNFLRIWSHLPKKFLMKNFIFCAVQIEGWDMNQQVA